MGTAVINPLYVELNKFNKPKQFPKDEILDTSERIARGWVSVEIRDKQGDIIPISKLKKVLNTWMKRGAPINDLHSNRQVGKGLRWMEGTHPKTNKQGVLIDYQIYSDYSADHLTWNQIKSGERTGLSIGGRQLKGSTTIVDGKPTNTLEEMELYEISSVDKPANQLGENIAVNYLAKSDKSIKVKEMQLLKDLQKGFEGDIQKPFAGFDNFDGCIAAQQSRNHSEESARRICGFLQARTERAKEEPAESEEPREDQETDPEENQEKIESNPVDYKTRKDIVGLAGYKIVDNHNKHQLVHADDGYFILQGDAILYRTEVPEEIKDKWETLTGREMKKGYGGYNFEPDTDNVAYIGLKIELKEHPKLNEQAAKQLVIDHLSDDPNYYVEKRKGVLGEHLHDEENPKGKHNHIKKMNKVQDSMTKLLKQVTNKNLNKKMDNVHNLMKSISRKIASTRKEVAKANKNSPPIIPKEAKQTRSIRRDIK